MADSPSSWLCELGMEDPLMTSLEPCDFMASIDEDFASPQLGEDFQQDPCCFPSESNSSSNSTNLRPDIANSSSASISSSSMELAPQIVVERPSKHQKPNAYTSSSSSGFILSFGNSNDTLPENPQRVPVNPEDEVVSSFLISQGQGSSIVNHEDGTMKSGKLGVKRKGSGGGGGGNPRPPSQTYDHIIAERKRREQLSQLFVALSGIVPGLKKTDKTSVLGEGVKYLKQLQERVKTLEDQSRKQTMESVVLVKKSQLSFADDQSCSDAYIIGRSSNLPLPEIEAKVCNKNILLRIHCERRKGVLVKLLGELEKLNLVVVNTSVAPFGSLALDITIIAEMETEFGITIKDLVKSLRPALRHFMSINAG